MLFAYIKALIEVAQKTDCYPSKIPRTILYKYEHQFFIWYQYQSVWSIVSRKNFQKWDTSPF